MVPQAAFTHISSPCTTAYKCAMHLQRAGRQVMYGNSHPRERAVRFWGIPAQLGMSLVYTGQRQQRQLIGIVDKGIESNEAPCTNRLKSAMVVQSN